MARMLLVVIAVFAMGLAGCKSGNASNPVSRTGAIKKASETAPRSLDFNIVSSGVQRGIHNQQLQVITTAKQFASLLSVTKLPGTAPKVDFSTHELIGVFLGANVGCGTDGLRINNVQYSDVTVTVYASRHVGQPNVAGGGCTKMRLAGLSYVLISIPKTDKPISLVFD